MNEKLAEQNVRLKTIFVFETKGKTDAYISEAGPLLAVEKIDKKQRTKLPSITPTYCPMCGRKLTELEDK